MDGLTQTERSLLDAIARAGPDGILLSVLRQNIDDARGVTDGIRSLMMSRKIQVARAPGSSDHIITVSKPAISENFSIIMGVIRSAGSSGIDVAGIGTRTKIPKTEITKAINQFISQQMIKETRCFTNKARKLYIAAEFEPSSEVTGGTFYTDARDLDVVLIDHMRQRIIAYLRSVGPASVQKLKMMLDQDNRIAQRRVTVREVATVARTLQLDGILRRTGQSPHESVIDGWGERSYMLVSEQLPEALAPGLGTKDIWAATFPCVSCPHLSTCHPRGVINPGSCAYLADWLDVSGSRATKNTGDADSDLAQPSRPQPRPSKGL